MKWLVAILLLPVVGFAQIDSMTNFGKANITRLYDDADTLIVLDSLGSRFPAGDFKLVWWCATNYGDPSDDPNREIVYVQSRSNDTLDVVRGYDGTSASTKNTAGKKYRVILSSLASDFDSVRTSLNTKLAASDTASLSSRIDLKLTATDTASLSSRIDDKIALSDSMTWILRQDSLLRDPTGFYDRLSTISFTNADHEFKIVGPFDVYCAGVKYTKASDSITVDSTDGIHYIYYDSTGVLSQSTDAWKINSRNAPVATVYYNTTYAKGVLSDERHGFMPGIVHEYVHETIGARFVSGLAGSFAAAGDTLRITAGEFYDDDIEFLVSQTDTVRVFYREGGLWNWTDPQRMYFDTLVNVPAYDNAGTRTQVGVAKYSNSWFFATDDAAYPIVVVMGQGEYATQALAEAVNPASLSFGALPVKEALLMYRVTWQRDGSAISKKTVTDYRAGNIGSVANYVPTDHRSLTNLDFANSGHTGFLGWTDTTASIATAYDISLKLNSSDTSTIRAYSNSLYLKNADSTAIRNYSNSLYLKNADSTSIRNYSNSLYLKNADSTSIRNYSNSLYWAKADTGAGQLATQTDIADFMVHGDTVSLSNRINAKLASSDTTGFRTYSNTLYNVVTYSTTYDSTALSTYGTRFVRSFFSTYSDSIAVDTVRAIMRGRANGDTVTVRIVYGVNGAATDSLADVKCFHATGLSVAQTKVIPPNNDVYVKIVEEDGASPEIAFTVKGRKRR